MLCIKKGRFIIHCFNFSNHYNFFKYLKNVIDLALLRSHDRVEYILEKRRIKSLKKINIEKNKDENFQLFFLKWLQLAKLTKN